MTFPYKIHATRFPTLHFVNYGPGHWQFVSGTRSDGWPSQVGPIYKTKAELLGDLTTYARESWGLV